MAATVDQLFTQTKQPWGKMFYDILESQLSLFLKENMRVLDFGSGFGITANYLAKCHDVTAIEPNDDMIRCAITNNKYNQILGGSEVLTLLKNDYFDLIICHNVLEYCDDPLVILNEFNRLLKPNGILSLVKINEYGKVMQLSVFESDPGKALPLVNNSALANTDCYGKVKIYSIADLRMWLNGMPLLIDNILGIRTFYALSQNINIKYDPCWYKKMLELEITVADKEPYKNIAYYNHIIIHKQ